MISTVATLIFEQYRAEKRPETESVFVFIEETGVVPIGKVDGLKQR